MIESGAFNLDRLLLPGEFSLLKYEPVFLALLLIMVWFPNLRTKPAASNAGRTPISRNN